MPNFIEIDSLEGCFHVHLSSGQLWCKEEKYEETETFSVFRNLYQELLKTI